MENDCWQQFTVQNSQKAKSEKQVGEQVGAELRQAQVRLS